MNEEKNSAVEPTSEGFREPPDRVTEPCLTYMARIMELRELIAFYFGFVNTSVELGKHISEDIKSKLSKQSQNVIQYKYPRQRNLINQIMPSRASESFDLYIITILRDIFLSRPEILKSEGNIDISTVIDVGNYEDLIWHIVERKIHDLSYRPLSELRKFILSRTGIDLFPSEIEFKSITIASELRNLIAHNDCIINDIFRTRTKGISIPLEFSENGRIKIDDVWLRKTSYMFDNIVFRFDDIASRKFNLHKLSRFGAFMLRE